MARSWIYLTLGVIAALIALGLAAIDTAIKQPNVEQIPTQPGFSPQQIMDIIERDLNTYVDLREIRLYSSEPPSIYLVYQHRNGEQFYIDLNTHEVKNSCNPKGEICPFTEQLIQYASNRLAYVVDFVWYAKDETNAPDVYVVDANSGEVLFSFISEERPKPSK